MLARLIGRRAAWLGLVTVGSAPMFCMIARQAIPDMPMVACTIGALALLALAVEDGETPDRSARPALARPRHARRAPRRVRRRRRVRAAAGRVLRRVLHPHALLGVRGRVPNPAVWLPA
jgi:hypothetical protein